MPEDAPVTKAYPTSEVFAVEDEVEVELEADIDDVFFNLNS